MTTHPRRRKSLAERIDAILSLPALKKRPKVKLLLICLIRHLNDEDVAWPKVETIVRATGISKGYIGTVCKQLEKLGYIERKKLKKGDRYPNPSGKPVTYSQYIYYLTPKLFDEKCEPNWKPREFRTNHGTIPGSLSETRSTTKTGSLSETGSTVKPDTLSHTNQVQSVYKPVSPSVSALYDQERNKKKDLYGQVKPAYAQANNRVKELSEKFESDEPIAPDFLRRVIAEAVEDKIPLSKPLRDNILFLEKRQLLSRLPNGKIADIGWRSPTPLSQLLNSRQSNTGNGHELDTIIKRITKKMNIAPSNTQ